MHRVLHIVGKEWGTKKAKPLINNDLTYINVTPIGFKPITAGAEIQCAIQLRHGAFFLASGANPFFKVAPRSLYV